MVAKVFSGLQDSCKYSNSIVLIVSVLPLISGSSSLFSQVFNHLQMVPGLIGITVTFMFYSFFLALLHVCLVAFFYVHSVFRTENDKFFSSCELPLGLVF